MNVFSEPIVFKLEDVFSWGIKKDKFKNYSLSIRPGDDTIDEITGLVKEHNTKNVFYGETLYLKIKSLTDKQRKELLDCGRCRIKVMFEVTGVFTNKEGTNHLVFKVKGLGKLEDEEEDEPPADNF